MNTRNGMERRVDQCPYCGSKGHKINTGIMIGQGVFVIGISFLLGFLIIPIIIGVPTGIGMVIAAFFRDDYYKCNTCNNTWKAGE